MTTIAHAWFTIEMTPIEAELPGTGKFAFTKQWSGEVQGAGSGTMLSAGDPAVGSAGYVVLETFTGTIAGRTGSCALQQFGTMYDGQVELRYEVVPGSGTGELAGLGGTLAITVVEGRHAVRLDLTVDGPPGTNQMDER